MSMPNADRALATLELLQGIMEHLEPPEIARCRRVSQWWKASVDSPSAGMVFALGHKSSAPVFDTHSDVRGTGFNLDGSKKTVISIAHNILLLAIGKRHVENGHISVVKGYGRAFPRGKDGEYTLLSILFPREAREYATADFRWEMFLTDPPINHVEVQRWYPKRDNDTEATFDDEPDREDVVVEGGVKLKHILELFEGKEDDGKWWSGKWYPMRSPKVAKVHVLLKSRIEVD